MATTVRARVTVTVEYELTVPGWHPCRLHPHAGSCRCTDDGSASCAMPDCDHDAWSTGGIFDAQDFWWCKAHGPETQLLPPAPESEVQLPLLPPMPPVSGREGQNAVLTVAPKGRAA